MASQFALHCGTMVWTLTRQRTGYIMEAIKALFKQSEEEPCLPIVIPNAKKCLGCIALINTPLVIYDDDQRMKAERK
jgi:hypothetical protein